jgi:hypothetical protein
MKGKDQIPCDRGSGHPSQLATRTYILGFGDPPCPLANAKSRPSEARFQVSLPTPLGGCGAFLDRPRDREVVYRAYELAMLREATKICRQIPPDDLALQWDVCVEVLEVAAGLPELLPGDPWTRAAAQFECIAAAVASPVMLGSISAMAYRSKVYGPPSNASPQ